MKSKAYIIGIGNFYKENSDYLHSKYDVIGYCDSNVRGDINGKKIYKPEEIANVRDVKMVIAISDGIKAIELEKELIMLGVLYNSIVFAANESPKMRFGYRLQVLDENAIRFENEGICCEFKNPCELVGLIDIFVSKSYFFSFPDERSTIVFDVGMNIGDSVVFFSQMKNVKKIYSWELVEETYNYGILNIKRYANKNVKINCFPYGLADRSQEREIDYYRGATTGISLLDDHNMRVAEGYGVLDSKCKILVKCKRCSDEFRTIFDQHDSGVYNFVLKLDCEGAEFSIIDDLQLSGMLSMFKIVIIEWHYGEKRKIIEKLNNALFTCWSRDESDDMGFIVAIK